MADQSKELADQYKELAEENRVMSKKILELQSAQDNKVIDSLDGLTNAVNKMNMQPGAAELTVSTKSAVVAEFVQNQKELPVVDQPKKDDNPSLQRHLKISTPEGFQWFEKELENSGRSELYSGRIAHYRDIIVSSKEKLFARFL